MAQYDVAIVGAGLAGLQCARLLGRAGLRVLLADLKRRAGDPVHTTGIFVRRTLDDFDLPESCLGDSVRDVVLHSPAGRRLRLTAPHDEFRVGRMASLYERFLQQALAAGVQWAPAHRLVDLRVDDAAALRFRTADRTHVVRARFVIGADGVGSTVARGLGLSRNREWIVGVEDVLHGARLDRGPDARPSFHCFLEPRLAPGYIAWLIDDGRDGLHVGVGGYPDRFDPGRALWEFRERIAGAFRWDVPSRVERRAGRIPVGGLLPRLANRYGLLVGDAAGAASPLTAGGLDACLRLSEFAARVVVNHLTDPSADAWARYDARRFAPRLVSRRLMRRAFRRLTSPLPIEAAFAAMRFTPLRAVAHHVFFGRGSFPDAPGRVPARWTLEAL